MTPKIILSAAELIVCPKCQYQFPIGEGITRQTIEKYEQDFARIFKEKELELSQELEQKAERKSARTYAAQLENLKEQLTERQEALTEIQNRLGQATKTAREKAVAEFEAEKKLLHEELSDKDSKLKDLREQEIALRKEKTRLENFQREMELEFQRKFDDEKNRLLEQIRNSEGERFRLKEAEYLKKIEDAQKANEALRRKLEQGSQQLQGEVFELELENILKNAFPFDVLEEIRKGARGADVLQTVITRTGQICGKIIWEAKRAENWSNAWIQKLKDDQQEAGAELAVLVTTSMPKQSTEPFCIMEDIWVVNIAAVRPMAETLRLLLLEAHKHKLIHLNKNEKMEALYHYLCSPQFAQKVRVVVDAFNSMKRDLDSEKAAMARLWKKREQMINRVTLNMMGMCGELQAIAEESLPQLDSIAVLPAPDDNLDQEL
jgi:hypothetical protein